MIKGQLPNDVITQIQAHLKEKSLEGEKGWDAGEDEEDTLTGDLLRVSENFPSGESPRLGVLHGNGR